MQTECTLFDASFITLDSSITIWKTYRPVNTLVVHWLCGYMQNTSFVDKLM